MALVEDPKYITQLEDMVRQMEVVASLTARSRLKYVFSLVITKCDLLTSGSEAAITIKQKLGPLTARMQAAHTVYQQFFCSTSIISIGNTSAVVARNASDPILWLVSELHEASLAHAPQNLGKVLKQTFSNRQKIFPSRRSKAILPRMVAILGAVSIGVGLWYGGSKMQPINGQARTRPPQEQSLPSEIKELKQALKKDPKDDEALLKMAEFHQQQQQYEPALDYLERLVALQPNNLNLYFQQAGLYASLERKDKEEAAYDAVLVQQHDNVAALTSKAILRSTQGDLDAARALFAKAEAEAPDGELKQTIQKVAADLLPTQ